MMNRPVTTGLLIMMIAAVAGGLSYGVLSIGQSGQRDSTDVAADGVEQQPQVGSRAVPSDLSGQAGSRTPVASQSQASTAAEPTTPADGTAQASTIVVAQATPQSGASAPPSTTANEPVTQFETITLATGTLVVAIHDGSTIEFWSAEPAAGWAYQVEDIEPLGFEIEFHSRRGEGEMEFEVRLVDGSLQVREDD